MKEASLRPVPTSPGPPRPPQGILERVGSCLQEDSLQEFHLVPELLCFCPKWKKSPRE